MNYPPTLTEKARCITARQDSCVSKHKGEHSGVLVEDGPRAILNPFKEEVYQNGRRVKEPNEPMFTLTVVDRHGIIHQGRIRRLECWRLQGFTTEQFRKVEATGLSDAQLGRNLQMNKTYRFLGKNGRTTIPIQIRRMLNIGRGDLIGYSIQGNTVVVTKEKLCKNCRKEHDSVQEMAEQLTPQERREMLSYALQVSSARSGYCAKSDPRFVEELNRKKPKTIEKIKELWYRGNMNEQYRHYSNTRYHALNLHSYFQHGHYEIRCCNASLHAGEVRAQIVLALAISNAAMTKKYCSPSVSHSDNMRYSFRVWLLNLGLIGDEYKNCRTHLLKHLTGDIAWRHPEDGIAQRERLRQERIAACEQEQQNESPCDERVGRLSIQGRHPFGFEQHPVSASGDPVSEVREEVGETPDENLEAAVSDCNDFEETEEICMTM